MTWIDAAWLVVGLLLGVLHARQIWRSATQPGAMTPVTGAARLLVIGLSLAVAAIFDGILSAAVGWLTGLVGTVGVVIATRSRNSQRRGAP